MERAVEAELTRIRAWHAFDCLMCRDTGLTLRRRNWRTMLTPRPSESDRRRLKDFYADYEDAPCADCSTNKD